MVTFRSRKVYLGQSKVGKIYGLAATGFGGSLMVLEVESMPGRGNLRMVGNLMKNMGSRRIIFIRMIFISRQLRYQSRKKDLQQV
jgi:ATP-dependent Lon protease